MTKAEQREAIRERARRALRDLYHNATPNYPHLDEDSPFYAEFDSWFQGAAESEIEYIRDGGAYPGDYHKTLEHPANGGRYKSERARAYYVRCGLRKRDEERAKYARWERIGEFGELYTYGRGGRTLAPKDLIRQRGGSSFGIRGDYADDLPIERVVDLILILEAFNAMVRGWNRSVPEMWAEYVSEREAEEKAERKRQRAARKEEKRREALRRCFC